MLARSYSHVTSMSTPCYTSRYPKVTTMLPPRRTQITSCMLRPCYLTASSMLWPCHPMLPPCYWPVAPMLPPWYSHSTHMLPPWYPYRTKNRTQISKLKANQKYLKHHECLLNLTKHEAHQGTIIGNHERN